ncbi:MAG TPA: type II secretion system protein [Planctomycetota bacterium]|nr:type II secretion system protein [Planctomycetota bacterium]
MRTRHGRRGRPAFTLIELLVVIAIIGVLAAFLLPAIARAQWTARKSKCINQLHQFALAVQTYRGSYDGDPPPWLSNLYPSYIPNEKMFLCPEDPTRGKDGGKPFWEDDPQKAYIETDDFDGSEADTEDADAAAVMNPDLKGNSYLYEFCCAECKWYDPSYSWNGKTATMEEVDVIIDTIHANGGVGTVTWREIKTWELKNVGPWTPMIRCFWHTGGTFARTDMVLNVGAETYHIYHSDTTGDGWKTQGNK